MRQKNTDRTREFNRILKSWSDFYKKYQIIPLIKLLRDMRVTDGKIAETMNMSQQVFSVNYGEHEYGKE